MVLVRTRQPSWDKYVRVLRDAFVSMDMAQNILVIKTVSGMAMAVAAAVDVMKFREIVGSIAGDDTIMAVRSVEDTRIVMDKIREILESKNAAARQCRAGMGNPPGSVRKEQ